ncbi:RING finger protein [Coccidioides immitis RS]|uniref:RING finger protein n=2 Tax=Coccidioides immitis TaxID=5501 RepID=A0A0E1RVI4_COCIM|nr:RING finger protein [Coccidioides immitis RS]EAS29958.2 RING finger protein [Coccidioides immitis RS]
MPNSFVALSDRRSAASSPATAMGQAGSSQRADFFRRTSSTSDQQIGDDHIGLSSSLPSMQISRNASEPTSGSEATTPSISELPASRGSTSTRISIENQERIGSFVHDGHEDLAMEGLSTQGSIHTRQSAQSSSSRQSTMSRLGSRIIPSSIRRSLHSRGSESSGESQPNRPTLFSRSGLSFRQDGRNRPQSPSLRNLGSRGIARRRSIRGPYALPRGESALLPESPPNPTFLSPDRAAERRRFSWRRHSRLGHVRSSIASPMSHIFGQGSPSTTSHASTAPPRRPSRSGFTEDSDGSLPPLRQMDSAMDLDEPHELDSVEPAARHVRSNSASSRYVPAVSEARRSPGAIRSRATRLLRRDESTQTPLSHILHLAASALAAQISGNATPGASNLQNIGADGLDGPLESLLQGLQHIASSQEEAGAGENSAEGGFPNVNFLRVFRFVNADNAHNSPSQSNSSESQEDAGDSMETGHHDPGEENPERRLLTLVVVGVRSIPANGSTGNESGTNARLNAESLLRLPFLSAGNLLRSDRGSSGFLRRGDGRTRFTSNRNSVAGPPIQTNHDSQRHQSTSSGGRSDAGSLADLSSSLPTVFSESPPGPNPPPSTPADPGLSGASSTVNTPSRRPSSASAFLPQLNEDSSGEAEAAAEQSTTFNFPRQRRRSDSEAARHRGLGSGAARRNGVVEPDDPSPSTTRSWLIYVVGANLAENHPALAAPSLFTDNPTYEDMMLLSSLLGPVKPPVASEEDVALAGGLYRLVQYPESLVAENAEDGERIQISENDRCLICLSDYAAEEEVRLLAKCGHIYHRECIDEWLTTGRNSCPLCRGEGVSNSDNHGNTAEPESNST